MCEFNEITYFYKPVMGYGIILVDSKISVKTHEENKVLSHDNIWIGDNNMYFVGWKIGDVPYSDVINIDFLK